MSDNVRLVDFYYIGLFLWRTEPAREIGL